MRFHTCAVLVLLVAAWNANVEGMPIAPDADSAPLGEAVRQPAEEPIVRKELPKPPPNKDAPQTVQTKVQEAKVKDSETAVKKALAAIHGDTSAKGGTPATSAFPDTSVQPSSVSVDGAPPNPDASAFDSNVDPSRAQPMSVPVPNMEDPASLVDHEPMITKPPPEEYINRNLKPGDAGYARQQADRAIYTYSHEMHHIDLKLQAHRDRQYDTARGSKNVYLAAKQGSHATAAMANAVRSQLENDLAHSEKQIDQIKMEMVADETDNAQHAKLQLQLERSKRKHAELLARAKTMGEAVDSAITKAGEIEGRARAQFHADMDPNMELEHAIIEAAKAKMALEQHDKQVSIENKEEAVDKKKEKYFENVQEKSVQALAKIKENGQRAREAAEEAAYKANMEASKKAMEAAESVGTIAPPPVDPTVSQKQLQQPKLQEFETEKEEPKPAATTVSAPAPAAPVAPAAVAAAPADSEAEAKKSAELAQQASAIAKPEAQPPAESAPAATEPAPAATEPAPAAETPAKQ